MADLGIGIIPDFANASPPVATDYRFNWPYYNYGLGIIRPFALTGGPQGFYLDWGAAPPVEPPTSLVKVWNGTAWVTGAKSWNGSTWEALTIWNGTGWIA